MVSQHARALRSNPTDAEACLWSHLRRRQIDGCRFRRQRPIGPYIVDFICLEARLILEIDGGQHAVSSGYETRRTQYLKNQGYRLLRFWNNDVLTNTDGVLRTIRDALLKK